MSDRDDKKPESPGPPESGSPPEAEETAAEETAAESSPEDKPAAEEKAAAAGGEEQPAEQAPEELGGEGEKEAAPDEAAVKAEEEAAAKAKAEAAAKAKAQAAAAAKAKAEAEAAKPPWERDPVVPEWQEAGDDPLAAALAAAHGEALRAARTFAGDLVLDVAPGGLRELATDLRDGHGFKLLVDVCGAHHPQREEEPFEVVYHLYSFEANRRVRLKVATADGAPVPSLTAVWRGANWPEREAWDMFGIRFEGHPDMTRILMWEGFNGHPLRKEFPVEGIDTGAAIYPEYYEEEAGPVTGTGTGWKPKPPPEPPAEDTEKGGQAPNSE